MMMTLRAGSGVTLLCALLCACGPEATTTSEGCLGAAECTVDDPMTGVDASSSSGSSTGTSSSSTQESASATGDVSGCTPPCWPSEGDDQARCSYLCDVFSQDCPDGCKCAAYDGDGDGAWDSVRCVDVMGDGQHGDACTVESDAIGVDDCALGVMCWDVDERGAGTCVALCTGSDDEPICTPPGTICMIANDSTLNLCLPSCDPLQQDCQDAEACIPAPDGEDFVCLLDASGGMAPEGTPCEFSNACDPGLMCASSEIYPNPDCQGSIGCCAPLCDTGNGDAECEGLSVEGAECVSVYEDPMQAPPEHQHVGVCALPHP